MTTNKKFLLSATLLLLATVGTAGLCANAARVENVLGEYAYYNTITGEEGYYDLITETDEQLSEGASEAYCPGGEV